MRGGRFFGRLETAFNPYDEDYLSEIVTAIVQAWKQMKRPLPSLEDRITFRLAACIKHDQQFRELPYDVTPQYWLTDPDGALLGRLDLHIKHRCSRRDYLSFEAKRLHVRYPRGKRSPEYLAYTGDAGMMAFIAGPYSEGLPAGGMLGYVMDGLTVAAWNGLAQYIEAERTALFLDNASALQQSEICDPAHFVSGAHLGETRHQLPARSFRMLHLLLPV